MIDRAKARQIVLDACSQGPQSRAMIAGSMLEVAPPDQIYLAARIAISDLLLDRKIESVQLHNGDVIYRLPANTPFEDAKKGTP
jgi:hypothetical protein